MKKEFSILNKDGKKITISGIKLIRIIHNSVKSILKHQNQSAEKKEVFQVDSPKFWIDAIGHLYKYATKHDVNNMAEWLPCKIKFSKDDVAPVTIASDSKVTFPISNHSYSVK